MGLDISLWVKSKKEYSDEELRELNYRFMEATSISDRVPAIKKEEINPEYMPNENNFYYGVYSFSRYYGMGYARGPWDRITMAINWLRFNFTDSEILYGGDCMVYECPVLTKEEQNKIDEFWYEDGGLSYGNRKPGNEALIKKCPVCDVVMSQYMWGGNKAGICCLGCKYRLETEDNGKTWTNKNE